MSLTCFDKLFVVIYFYLNFIPKHISRFTLLNKKDVIYINKFKFFINAFVFLKSSSEHGKDIPMVFVFGVATTVSTVHSMLSHSATSRLSIEKFQSQPSLLCLTDVVDQV